MTKLNNFDLEGSYRDSVATISKEGKRNIICPKRTIGKFYKRRTLFSIFYLIVFFLVPFIYVNDEPFMMFNVLERKFILFGMIFWPQDFFIFGLGMLTFIVFVILFTVVFGRIFCGWACPQTIFMEMVFRKIEYWIDGDSAQQKRLEKQIWNAEKIRKRTFKFLIFFSLSFLIANFFLAYLIGMKTLLLYIPHPAVHIGTLISLLIFTIVFFLVYWWFREQACIVICPYGRLQGVFLDKNSIVVAYDSLRGEPRGIDKKSKNKIETDEHEHDDCKCTDCKGDGACKDLIDKLNNIGKHGDCIDCEACVKACPTGIDIRNGTQLECINCTACIDACDNVMDRIKKPRGLIRYATENSILTRKKLILNAKVKAYSVVLILLISLLVFILASRTDLDVRLMRTAGMTYTALPDGRINNLYNLKLTNKTHKDLSYEIRLENIKGEISLIGKNNTSILKESYDHCQFFVTLNRQDVKSWKTELIIGIYEKGKKTKTIKSHFIGPEVYK